MHNATMYCLCLHNKVLPTIKKLGYVPVGLGKDNFSAEWIRDNTLNNISHKNKYYGEYTFHYWFWKNKLKLITDDSWTGFCTYRRFWTRSEDIHEIKKKTIQKYTNRKHLRYINFLYLKFTKVIFFQ